MRLSDYALQESPNDNESTGEQRISKMIYDAIQNCISCVEEQPTAYDVDKVVEELEALKNGLNIKCDSLNEALEKGKKVGYNKAIDDFVKKISESNQGHWRVTRYEHGEAVSETMSYDIGTLRLIAEQLKAGLTND